MAQGNNYGQSSNGVADESPNMLVYRKVGSFFSYCITWHLEMALLVISFPVNEMIVLQCHKTTLLCNNCLMLLLQLLKYLLFSLLLC